MPAVSADDQASLAGQQITDAPDPHGTDAGTSPTLEGARVGTYVLTREIGSGAAATVYLAEDTKHRRQVALKLLHGEASSALGSERFRREIEVRRAAPAPAHPSTP